MSASGVEYWKRLAWVPWLLMGIAFLSAYLYSNTEAESSKAMSASSFGISLGLALCVWGLEEYQAKKIRGLRAYVNASDSPKSFAALLMMKRFLPGLTMIVAGAWFFISGGG